MTKDPTIVFWQILGLDVEYLRTVFDAGRQGPCLPWPGSVQRDVPRLWADKRWHSALRIAWAWRESLKRGGINLKPPPRDTVHRFPSCDRRCVNPMHLEARIPGRRRGTKRRVSPEALSQARERIRAGESVRSVAKATGVPVRTVRELRRTTVQVDPKHIPGNPGYVGSTVNSP